MSESPIRTEPDQVDPPWLTEVMAPSGWGAVDSVRHEPVGTGLMARSYRFVAQTSTGERTVVGKFPSADEGTRELGARAYTVEHGFYTDLAPRCAATVPHCHHAEIDETGRDFVLLLEDLAPRQQGDQIAGCTIAEAEAAIGNLARLHSSTWGDHSIGELPWAARDAGTTLSAYMGMAYAPFCDRFEALVSAEALATFGRFVDAAEAWSEAPVTNVAAVHGDYRLDNLMFSPDGDEVAAVDWQTVSLANPGRDVAYFLGNSLTTDDRRAAEHALVDHYLDELERGGVAGYTVDQCWSDVRWGTFQGPLVTMLGAFTAARTERSEHMFAAMAERSAAQIIDHEALALL